MSGPAVFWGLTAEGWTAVAAIATATTVAVALWQALVVRFQQKQTHTLEVCGQYDLNENIQDALCKLWDAKESGELMAQPRKFRPQIGLVLNHLDAIAIGIKQQLYTERIAYDHLHVIVQHHVTSYVDTDLLEKAGVPREAYTHLIALAERWKAGRPRFRYGITWTLWSRKEQTMPGPKA